MKHRVVITGLGLITPIGVGVTQNWQALRQGRCCIKPISSFDASNCRIKLCGEISNIDCNSLLPNIRTDRIDRSVVLSLLAAQEAIRDANLNTTQCNETGVMVGTGFGTIQTKEETYLNASSNDAGIHSLIILKGMDNAAASEIAIRFGLKGINQTIFTACSSGAMAIGDAYRLISQGHEKRVLAGGVDTPITQFLIKAWDKLHVISRCSDPTNASQPFSKGRDGFVLSEGAAFLVLEDADAAENRGAPVYAEISGFGANCDAKHLTTPDPDTQRIAINKALDDAQIRPDQIKYINAHGTGTVLNDQIETQAIKKTFGQQAYKIPISASKSQLGHMIGACGAAEAILTVLMMQNKLILPTIHYEEPDPLCDLDYVPNIAREVISMDYALKTSFGFGGANAVLVFKKSG